MSDPRNIHAHARNMLIEQIMALIGRAIADPLSDLNAIAAAEATLTDDEFYLHYTKRLSEIVYDKSLRRHTRNYLSATALQRATAFCRAFWPERFE